MQKLYIEELERYVIFFCLHPFRSIAQYSDSPSSNQHMEYIQRRLRKGAHAGAQYHCLILTMPPPNHCFHGARRTLVASRVVLISSRAGVDSPIHPFINITLKY